MSSVVVVVIVGVVIAAIAGATLHEGKPATPTAKARRAPEPPLPPPAAAPTSPPAPPSTAPTGEPTAWAPAERPIEGVPDERGLLDRARSGALLAVVIVVLGSLAAGGIGGALYLGVHVLSRAVK